MSHHLFPSSTVDAQFFVRNPPYWRQVRNAPHRPGTFYSPAIASAATFDHYWLMAAPAHVEGISWAYVLPSALFICRSEDGQLHKPRRKLPPHDMITQT